MAIHGKIPKTAAICIFAFALSAVGSSLFAQTIHAVVVGDVSPASGWGKLSPNIVMDTLNFGAALESNLPNHQLKLVSRQLSEDEQSDPQAILQLIEDLNPRREDTVVFYYSGHGAADDQGHYFALAKGKLRRNQVLEAILRKKPRLAVLISDCCSLRSDGELYFAPYFQTKRPSSPTPLFRSLFLEPKGIVDINSSAPGEGAFFAPSGDELASMHGSIFTIALKAWVEKNKSQRRVWDDLVRGVSLQVHASFHDYFPKGIQASNGGTVQTQQNVFPFQYPGMPENKGPRTGLLVRDFPGKGAVITKVEANSPASQVFLVDKEIFASLTPQQVIVSINGEAVENTDQLIKALAQSPQIVRLRIRDSAKGEFDVLVRMRY